MSERSNRFAGCLLGGAVGDALGAPVEFLSLQDIRASHGPGGIHDFSPAYGRRGAITDDTQMTLFTAEGLMRAQNRFRDRGICLVPGVIHRAYLRWLFTQGSRPRPDPELRDMTESGWLVAVPELHSRRAPGNTCLSALESGRAGTPVEPINESKGCGGVMRVAPVGLIAADAFELGSEVAALTHGHPSGYLAAGHLAAAVAGLASGTDLEPAIERANGELRTRPGHEECLAAVENAMHLATQGDATAERVESLGEGWIAEEALAISLYCALVASDFEHGVVLAVNHGGDSDSTGAITGNVLGTLMGVEAIPSRWLEALELRDEIMTVARDLDEQFGGAEPDWERYPPW